MPEQQQNDATDADAVEEELDDVQEEADGDDDAPEWTPPTREEWEAQQAALAAAQAKTKRANDQARKLREAKQQAATTAASGAEPTAANTEDLAKWQARAVRAAAKVQLIARGADADMVDLALGRLKPADIEFDNDDEPDLVDWLDDLEDRFPKLFKQPEAPAPAAAKAKAGRVETPTGRGVRPKMSLGEQIMANSQGATRRPR